MSLPTRVARISSALPELTVPPITASPGWRRTGSDSPGGIEEEGMEEEGIEEEGGGQTGRVRGRQGKQGAGGCQLAQDGLGPAWGGEEEGEDRGGRGGP